MNRIMKRPMFRKGGSAGEGITSGLAPRQGYATNEDNTVKQNDLSKVNFDNDVILILPRLQITD